MRPAADSMARQPPGVVAARRHLADRALSPRRLGGTAAGSAPAASVPAPASSWHLLFRGRRFILLWGESVSARGPARLPLGRRRAAAPTALPRFAACGPLVKGQWGGAKTFTRMSDAFLFLFLSSACGV